ncbi:hypothetical protein DWB61_11505 [Ancylomarina euxinus]|uniref:Peptidase M56 domain-containing protein n=1 Tax=Ancylomarina euxinus TaxID=2283627 RepID=A0A425XZE2_9BACT|nr:biopolymer transporter ExbD [Ancylomarina euxinus]MCZ4695536.1 biopolymer transporter ExbD [Ancylomarina euxinus]MUP15647.1 hypothetical protein [Ancylomarina euxinus]RRG20640.1 hypothetical protein DWB61_11505 [Ancylomarina euxinus]
MLIFITYMIKVGISLAFFCVLYKLLLNRDANHRYKRRTLLLSVCAAFAMPLVAHLIPANEISSTPIQKVREMIEMPLLETAVISSHQKQTLVETSDSNSINWAAIVYCSILSMLCIRMIVSYQSILKWLKKATIKTYKDILVAIVSDAIQAFSFLNYIVLSKQDYEQNKTPILLHEEAHIRLHHSFDVVLIELVCYLQWFNPFAWLLKKELKLVHEFQADQAVLNTGIDATQYQLLILEKAVGKRRFASANHFKQGSISKRLKMMKKKQIKRWGVAKALFFLPMGLLLLQAFTQPEIIKKVNTLPPLIIQADSSEIWLSYWTVDNLPQNSRIVTKYANMGEQGIVSEAFRIKQRNVLVMLQNRNGDHLINGQVVEKKEVEAIIISFLKGNDYWGRVGPEMQKVNLNDEQQALISKGVISFMYDRGTKKSDFDFTLKALGKAYLKVRKEKAQALFNRDYFQLDKTERSHIDNIVPIRVSVPPSKNTGNSSNIPERVPQVSSQKASNSIIYIQITNESIFLNGKACPINQLGEKLKPILDKNPNSVVSLKADKNTKMGIITDVKVELRKASVKKLNYSTSAAQTIKLNVTKDGISFNNKLCTMDQLALKLKPYLEKNPNATVQFSSRKDIKQGILNDLIKQLRLAGVSTITYLVEES